MNPLTPPLHGLDTFAAFALQVCIPVVLAGLAQRFTRSPHRRRAIWYAAFFGLALINLNAALGIEGRFRDHRSKAASTDRAFIVRGNLPRHSLAAEVPVDRANLASSLESQPMPALPVEAGEVMRWIARGWLVGMCAVLIWSLLPRLGLAILCKRNKSEPPPQVGTRLRELERRLLLQRPVRVLVWSRLSSPIAFGVLRPTIGLPADFWSAYSPEEQDAMLTHELAHLAARDPAGLGCVDLLTALLWWHPMMWWARREFRTATEAAADEASLMLDNGPAVLAECLIRVASRWQQRGLLGLLGVAGFRSGLGKRVQRLLEFCQTATPPTAKRLPVWWVTLLGGFLASVAAVGAIRWIPSRLEPPLLAVVIDSLNPSVEPAQGSSSEHVPAAAHPLSATPTSVGQKEEKWTKPYLQTVLAQQKSEIPGIHDAQTSVSIVSSNPGPQSLNSSPSTSLVSSETPSPRSASTASSDPQVAFDQTFEAYLKAKGKSSDQIQTLLLRANHLVARMKSDSRTLDPAEVLTMVEPDSTDSRVVKIEAVRDELFTRSYHVNPGHLLSALSAVTGRPADAEASPLEALRHILLAAGIDFRTPPNGRSLFYNDRNGIVLVRARLPELDTIDQVLQTLNTAPPQVMIEAKFVEISRPDGQPLNLARELGDGSGQTPPGTGHATHPVNTVDDLLQDSRFREVVMALQKSSAQTAVSDKVQGDQLEWSGKNATNAARIVVDQAAGGTFSGILTDPQFRAVLRRLEGLSGVDVLSAPKVTTLSQRRAQVQVSDVKSVITGLNPGALLKTQPSTTNPPTFTVAQIPVGPVLDVLPVVSSDGATVRLTVTPTITEFLGYDKPPKDARQRVWENGASRLVDVPLPRMRIRQMTTETLVSTGQTLVMGGMPIEETIRTKDTVPVLGDIPLLGRLFRREGKYNIRKTLLVFVTATIVDPAGNPVTHSKP